MPDFIETRGGKLELVRIYDLRLVPKELLQQIDGVRYELLMELNQKMCADPTNLFYALVTDENAVVGLLVLYFNGLEERLGIYFLGLLPEYQGIRSPSVPQQITRFVDSIRARLQLTKPVVFATRRPRVLERHGYQRDGVVSMMCLTEE